MACMLRGLWIFHAESDVRLLMSRRFPTVEKKMQRLLGEDYVALPCDEDINLMFITEILHEEEDHYIPPGIPEPFHEDFQQGSFSWNEEQEAHEEKRWPMGPISSICKGKIWPVLFLFKKGFYLVTVVGLEKKYKIEQVRALELPQITAAFSVLEDVCDFIPSNLTISDVAGISELQYYIRSAIPFGSPVNTNYHLLRMVRHGFASKEEELSQRSPAWKPYLYKGKSKLTLLLVEMVNCTLYGKPEYEDECFIAGTVYCCADIGGIPEICVPISYHNEQGSPPEISVHNCAHVVGGLKAAKEDSFNWPKCRRDPRPELSFSFWQVRGKSALWDSSCTAKAMAANPPLTAAGMERQESPSGKGGTMPRQISAGAGFMSDVYTGMPRQVSALDEVPEFKRDVTPGQISLASGASVAEGELAYTGKFCGGVRADLKRRCPWMVSDWVDAFKAANLQLASSSIFFLFFVCLTPALTFGAIMGDETNNQLGVVETILSTAIVGLIYAAMAGQPLCIQGATGPELAYTLVFYKICEVLEIDFLTARLWQAMWCGLITVVLAVTDACCAVHHFTRFVEDIFAALISWIFIFSALRSIITAYFDGPVQMAFLRTLLAVFTYLFTMTLKGLNSSLLCNAKVRNTLANFSAPLAILIFSGLANIWREEVDIAWLEVPENFEPTAKDASGQVRSWIISPFGPDGDFPIWAIFAIIVPALGLALLGYLDQNLTTIIINRPSNGLKKPGGYHLDLLVCGLFVYPLCGVLGLPFTHNSTAPSLIHLMSLTKYAEETLDDGTKRKVAVEVVEQRFTGFAIHILVAVSLLLAPLLKYVPKAVTFGIFLVMGISSMAGNQLFERWNLWTIFDSRNYPQYYYVKKVAQKQLHRFTTIQVTCFLIVFFLTEIVGLIGKALEIEAISLVPVIFPFFLSSLVFVRKAMPRCFGEHDLAWLDARFEPAADDDKHHKKEGKTEAKAPVLESVNEAQGA